MLICIQGIKKYKNRAEMTHKLWANHDRELEIAKKMVTPANANETKYDLVGSLQVIIFSLGLAEPVNLTILKLKTSTNKTLTISTFSTNLSK